MLSAAAEWTTPLKQRLYEFLLLGFAAFGIRIKNSSKAVEGYQLTELGD